MKISHKLRRVSLNNYYRLTNDYYGLNAGGKHTVRQRNRVPTDIYRFEQFCLYIYGEFDYRDRPTAARALQLFVMTERDLFLFFS